jgi:hypothetical protein
MQVANLLFGILCHIWTVVVDIVNICHKNSLRNILNYLLYLILYF